MYCENIERQDITSWFWKYRKTIFNVSLKYNGKLDVLLLSSVQL